MKETRRIKIITTRRRTLRVQFPSIQASIQASIQTPIQASIQNGCPICGREVETFESVSLHGEATMKTRFRQWTSKIAKRALLVMAGSFLPIILVGLSAIGTFTLAPDTKVSGQPASKGWRVWVKISPCAGGRTDWISVAREYPAVGGLGHYQIADIIAAPLRCTLPSPHGCTFAEAMAEAEAVRASPKFSNYCCRDYSVWEDTRTKEMSAVKGMGSAGSGWLFVKGNLCCEEAEAMTGKTGLCGGTRTGPIGCFKDTSDFDLNGHLERSATNTPQRCIETCRQKGFAYAAVQYGQSCLCGDSYGKYGKADNCNYKCTGDPNQICGGYSANSVYSTGINVVPGRGVTSGGGKDKGKTDGSGGDLNNPAAGRWTLVSVTAAPETRSGWSYSAQSASAQMKIYNGDRAAFQWTPPPQQFDGAGFTIALNAQSIPAPKSRIAVLLCAGLSGLATANPNDNRCAEANGQDGASASGQRSLTLKPQSGASEIEVKISMMWGEVNYTYKYRRVQ